jgi:hypothetical protein
VLTDGIVYVQVAVPAELRETEMHPLRLPFGPVNVTVPVGVPDAADTVAVKVSVCPTFTGSGEVARVVVVAVLDDVILRDTVTLLDA